MFVSITLVIIYYYSGSFWEPLRAAETFLCVYDYSQRNGKKQKDHSMPNY